MDRNCFFFVSLRADFRLTRAVMIKTIVLLSFAAGATIHLVLCVVAAVFAHYRVKYLALAWILGICAAVMAVVGYYSESVAEGQPEMLHPAMMWMLLIGTFLQSIYTFGFSMPGFLQWERMVRYASPIMVIGVIQALFPDAWWLGLLSLMVGVGYIANIYIMPRRLAKKTPIPSYLKGYTFFMALSYAFYIYVSLHYNPALLCIFVLCFTLLNCFLVLITLKGLAQHLPQPGLNEKIEAAIGEETEPQMTDDDFNERNLARYQMIEHWMSNNKEAWMDFTFNRDCLCREVGLNRQLVLQCLRSQGHNNVHEYLMLYRVKELRSLIERGEITQLSECVDAGFGVVKTAKTCFKKIEGVELDEFLEGHRRGSGIKAALVAVMIMLCCGTAMARGQVQPLSQQTPKGDVSQKRKMSNSAFPVQISKMGNALKIQSDHNQILPIYTQSGAFYMVMRLTKGTNFLSGLPRGRYFINNRIVSIGIETE